MQIHFLFFYSAFIYQFKSWAIKTLKEPTRKRDKKNQEADINETLNDSSKLAAFKEMALFCQFVALKLNKGIFAH